jgi:hypothetical protein
MSDPGRPPNRAKVIHIELHIKTQDDRIIKCISGKSRLWMIHDLQEPEVAVALYSRHLRMLADLDKLISEADK